MSSLTMENGMQRLLFDVLRKFPIIESIIQNLMTKDLVPKEDMIYVHTG